jgi:hypothetical protein
MPAPDFITLLPADATEYTQQQIQAMLDAVAAAGDEKHIGAGRNAQRKHLGKIIPTINATISATQDQTTRALFQQAKITLETQISLLRPSLGLKVMKDEDVIQWYLEALESIDPEGKIKPPEGGVGVLESIEARWLGPAVVAHVADDFGLDQDEVAGEDDGAANNEPSPQSKRNRLI